MGRVASSTARRVSLSVALVLLVAPGALPAQELRARLLGRPEGTPVDGALVQLRSGEEILDQEISGPAGYVELEAAGDGIHHLRVQRIGYRTWNSGPIRPRSEPEAGRRTFRVPLDPVRLERMDVPLGRRCRMPADQGRRLTRLWDQIETALALTDVARRSDRRVFTVRAFRRIRDRSGRLIGLDSAAVDVRRSLRPFDPPPADSLDQFGFMVEEDPGQYRYYAPAPRTLRSGTFFDTHCLRLRPGASVGRPGWIGVSFRPAPGRRLPEVAGTLWLDRERARLRRLDFRYVNLGFPDAPELDGRVEFLRLPSNRWIIESWFTQIPRLSFETNLEDNRPARLEVRGIDETGAEVLSVQGRGSGLLYHHRRSTLYGTVRAGGAASGERYAVRVVSATKADTIRVPGDFAFPPLRPGRHRLELVRVRSRRGDVLVHERELELEPGEVRRLEFEVPARRERECVRLSCLS